MFHYLEREVFQTNGQPNEDPILLLVDEAWRFLGDTMFVHRLNSWLRLLRKLNVVVVFATQFLKDALEGPLAAALNESCPNRFLLANEKAREPATRAGYHALGMNDAEIDRIARMVPKRDYYHSSPAGKRMFRLGLGPIGMQVCGSSYPDALIQCDRLVACGGDFAENWFAEEGMHWAADLVAADRAGLDEVPAALAAE